MKAAASERRAPAGERSHLRARIPRNPLPRVPRAGSRRQGGWLPAEQHGTCRQSPERRSRPSRASQLRNSPSVRRLSAPHVAPRPPPHFRCALMTLPNAGVAGSPSAVLYALPEDVSWPASPRLRPSVHTCALLRSPSTVQNKSPLLASGVCAGGLLGLPSARGFCPPGTPDPKAHFDN